MHDDDTNDMKKGDPSQREHPREPRDERRLQRSLDVEPPGAPHARELSIEPVDAGLAVHAPDFYVWDTDRPTALAWAADLQRVSRRPGHHHPQVRRERP